jgi:hypothetical protein
MKLLLPLLLVLLVPSQAEAQQCANGQCPVPYRLTQYVAPVQVQPLVPLAPVVPVAPVVVPVAPVVAAPITYQWQRVGLFGLRWRLVPVVAPVVPVILVAPQIQQQSPQSLQRFDTDGSRILWDEPLNVAYDRYRAIQSAAVGR